MYINLKDSLKLSNKVSKFLDIIDPVCVIHLGTENPNYIELKRKKDFYRNNLDVTKNLIEYFSSKRPDKKLILIGTSQMYKTSKKKVDLKSKFNPTNSYAKFRVAAYKCMLREKKKNNLIKL